MSKVNIQRILHYKSSLLTLLLAVFMLGTASAQKPWVTLESRPNNITKGLAGHHLSVWPSHGRYYNFKKDIWEYQRPLIFGTAEDLFTQSIVIPYLIPMLENAGANVFVPRERDWQNNEYIVDNDKGMSGYMERKGGSEWKKAPRPGFTIPERRYRDGDRPFAMGTARMALTTNDGNYSAAIYKPNISESGRYAVYVSYQTVENSIDDAEYVVVHQGIPTRFKVNQQMGSGTWVYLGTFEFDKYSTFQNYVMVTTNSKYKGGIVTTDAVRFGAGIGNHERGGRISHLPKAMECSRYWAQFAGAPRAVVCSKGETDDYGDDINARSLMTNWISYGSKFNPTEFTDVSSYDNDTLTLAERASKAYLDSIATLNLDSAGLAFADSMAHVIADSVARQPVQMINVVKGNTLTGRVPIEMQLAIHSDAGWAKDGKSNIGTLSICTSAFNGGKLASGQPRIDSFNFASELLYGLDRDIKKAFGTWTVREVYDRNYSETRLPAQTSAILETLSHENFPDIRMGHDPYFKFVVARSIYKVILRHLAKEYKYNFAVQPLAPHRFSADEMKANVLTLRWQPTKDSTEVTSDATSYNVYTRIGDGGYDNGRNVKDNAFTVALRPNVLYRFKVTAVNAGGESFPTEELVAMYHTGATKTALVVNGFHRLASPQVIDNDSLQGFDLDADIGLSYGKTPAWVGRQVVFDKTKAGRSYNGLGTTNNDFLGRFTAGNDFNYTFAHADAIAATKQYNVVSMSSELLADSISINKYDFVDVLLGNERNDGYSLRPYKTFTPGMMASLREYAKNGGRLLVSGSYVASDMQESDIEREFLANTLHTALDSIDRDSLAFNINEQLDQIHFVEGSQGQGPMTQDSGSGRPVPATLSVYRHVNEQHYASVASDVLRADEGTQPLMAYESGLTAAVVYRDEKTKVVTMGFPFECIKKRNHRIAVMRKVLE